MIPCKDEVEGETGRDLRRGNSLEHHIFGLEVAVNDFPARGRTLSRQDAQNPREVSSSVGARVRTMFQHWNCPNHYHRTAQVRSDGDDFFTFLKNTPMHPDIDA